MILAQLYVRILDAGHKESVSIDQVLEHVRNGTVLKYLGDSLDEYGYIELLNMAKADNSEMSFETWYSRYLQSILSGGGKTGGVENNGICLLLMWTIEIIQQGNHWQPNSDVAGLWE